VREVEQQSGNFVQVGFVLRHGPIFGSLHRWISQGRLGSPLDLRISVFDEVLNPAGDPAHYQRIMATLKHGAPCIHDGAHTMDHLHYLLNAPPARLVSWGRTTRPEFPRPNLNSAMIEFVGGHRARVEIGWFLPEFPRSEWSIIGPRGLAWFDQPSGTVFLRSESGNEDIQLQEDWFVSCFRHQLETFVRGIRSRIPPEPGSAAGIASLQLCQAFESGMSQSFTPQELPMP
jgi:predicted dehydrogenase